MKAWIVSLCLFALLLGAIIGNAVYVRHVAAHVESEARMLSFDDAQTDGRLSALEAYWERHRPYVALSIGYRELDHLSEALIGLRTAYDTKASADFTLYRRLTADAAQEMARLERLSVENLF